MAPLLLVDKVEALKAELGLASTAASVPSSVAAIAEKLGMAEAIQGKPLVEQVNACYAAVFSTESEPAAITATDPANITVVTGIPVGSSEAAPKATPAAGRDFTFSACNNASFDTHGVLYALGSDYGRAGYQNPADSGKVHLSWSADAANYYSTAGGHKQGDTTQAARVICAHTHPGSNATQWSLGKAGAWFCIDLVSIELRPTHFAFRNDYGGSGNHPRTFELQGSHDGRNWSTLSAHTDHSWSGKQAQAWPITSRSRDDSGPGQHYRLLRVLNKGKPDHLCCSGIELYGNSPDEITAAGVTLPFVLCPWSYKLKRKLSARRFELRAKDQNQDWDWHQSGCCMWGSPGWWAVKVVPGNCC